LLSGDSDESHALAYEVANYGLAGYGPNHFTRLGLVPVGTPSHCCQTNHYLILIDSDPKTGNRPLPPPTPPRCQQKQISTSRTRLGSAYRPSAFKMGLNDITSRQSHAG
jgi:hypothetical protein